MRWMKNVAIIIIPCIPHYCNGAPNKDKKCDADGEHGKGPKVDVSISFKYLVRRLFKLLNIKYM